MANIVRLPYSNTATNTPSSLGNGVLAINQADGTLYYRNASGVVTQLATGGGGGGGLVEYATTASFPATGATATLYLATDTRRVYSWTGIVYAEVGAVSSSPTDSRWDLFLPPAPTGVSGTAGNAQVALTWTAPTVSAQTPITSYAVQYSSNSGSTWTTWGTAPTTNSATVTSLTNSTAYVFRVAAMNGVGIGAYSSASASVTPTSVTFVAIPLMTSATTPSGTASASAILSPGLDAFRAFDKVTVTSDASFYAAPSPSDGQWIQYDFGPGVLSRANGYQITSRYDPTYGSAQQPTSWTLGGSNDGSTFTTIDTRTSQTFGFAVTNSYTLSAAATYRYWRWTWTATPSGGAVITPKIQLTA